MLVPAQGILFQSEVSLRSGTNWQCAKVNKLHNLQFMQEN